MTGTTGFSIRIWELYRDVFTIHPQLLLMATRNPVNSPVEEKVVEIPLFTAQFLHPRWEHSPDFGNINKRNNSMIVTVLIVSKKQDKIELNLSTVVSFYGGMDSSNFYSVRMRVFQLSSVQNSPWLVVLYRGFYHQQPIWGLFHKPK